MRRILHDCPARPGCRAGGARRASPATLAEIGVVGEAKTPAVPSCPASPCLAVSRTTGFQVKVGSAHNPMNIPRDGSIVAWTVTLAKPTAAQIKYFNSSEGGPAEAGIAVLRAAEEAEPRLQADRPGPDREAGKVLRPDGPVPAAERASPSRRAS